MREKELEKLIFQHKFNKYFQHKKIVKYRCRVCGITSMEFDELSDEDKRFITKECVSDQEKFKPLQDRYKKIRSSK